VGAGVPAGAGDGGGEAMLTGHARVDGHDLLWAQAGDIPAGGAGQGGRALCRPTLAAYLRGFEESRRWVGR
jgi:hypothetical protein